MISVVANDNCIALGIKGSISYASQGSTSTFIDTYLTETRNQPPQRSQIKKSRDFEASPSNMDYA